jgi:hypothetical protein
VADVLVAGTSDGRLGFIDVKSARLLHVRPPPPLLALPSTCFTLARQVYFAHASRVTRLFIPDGCDAAGGGKCGSSQNSSFSVNTVVAADSVAGGTWVGALEYSDPALLALGP